MQTAFIRTGSSEKLQRALFAVAGILLLLLVAIFSARSFAEAKLSSPSTVKISTACVAPQFRQFDFWIGAWKVRNAAGKEIGRSEITPVAGGCAIRETWTSSSGITGTSINYQDPKTTRWHQHWVGSDGSILQLAGGLQDGAMILSGESGNAPARVANRITWTSLPGGKVKQEWITSEDGGKTWKASFVGFYERG